MEAGGVSACSWTRGTLKSDSRFADSVRTNIEKCDEFLVLFSRYSKDRPWVLAEMGAAWGLQKPIIVIIDKVGPKEMPDIVSPYRAVDLNDFDEYLGQPLKRVKSRR